LVVTQESVPCITLGNYKQCSHLPRIVPPREQNKEGGRKRKSEWFYLPPIKVENSRRLFLRTHTLALRSAQCLNRKFYSVLYRNFRSARLVVLKCHEVVLCVTECSELPRKSWRNKDFGKSGC